MKQPTHKEKVLALLSDGRPHTHHELYALHVIAHSRISDLRRDGHEIAQWREDDLYWYRLVSPLNEPPVASASPPSHGVLLGVGGSLSGGLTAPSNPDQEMRIRQGDPAAAAHNQLTIEEAA